MGADTHTHTVTDFNYPSMHEQWLMCDILTVFQNSIYSHQYGGMYTCISSCTCIATSINNVCLAEMSLKYCYYAP